MVFGKPATVVVEPIADDQILGPQQQVVGKNLVKGLLGYLDVRGFVLDNHAWAELGGVEHAVGPQRLGANLQLDLVGKQRGRVALGLY